MENKVIEAKLENEVQVQEQAFMVITPKQIGVSSSLDDIIDVMGDCFRKLHREVTIVPGEKTALLAIEHKILTADNVLAMEGTSFQYPDIPKEGCLYNRKVRDDGKSLPKVLKKIW